MYTVKELRKPPFFIQHSFMVHKSINLIVPLSIKIINVNLNARSVPTNIRGFHLICLILFTMGH